MSIQTNTSTVSPITIDAARQQIQNLLLTTPDNLQKQAAFLAQYMRDAYNEKNPEGTMAFNHSWELLNLEKALNSYSTKKNTKVEIHIISASAMGLLSSQKRSVQDIFDDAIKNNSSTKKALAYFTTPSVLTYSKYAAFTLEAVEFLTKNSLATVK